MSDIVVSANSHNYLFFTAGIETMAMGKYTSGDPVQVWMKQLSTAASSDFNLMPTFQTASEDPSNPGRLALLLQYWKSDSSLTYLALFYFEDDGTDLSFRPLVRTDDTTNNIDRVGSTLFTDSQLLFSGGVRIPTYTEAPNY